MFENTKASYSSGYDSTIEKVFPRVTRSQMGIIKPNPKYVRVVTPCKVSPPNSVKVALASLVWKKAIEEEYNALVRNDTWVLVPRSHNNYLIASIWIYKVKQKENKSVERLKA